MNTEETIMFMIMFMMALLACISMIGMGLCFLLPSPRILRIDRKKDCCLLGKKFFWQKQYKMKTLCKLSEVKEAIIEKRNPFQSRFFKLCLKLKSEKNVVVFLDDGFYFDDQLKEINRFLNSEDEQFEIAQRQSFFTYFWAVLCVFGCCFAFLYILKTFILEITK